ncbi:hypothetical protein LPJ38_11325 [Bradyrhizobium daqingense]|uniref:SPW repeat-containing protein n=1 Tax=Bradyrhizobium daqingense TaxID=993502 RepID=A0A562LDM1_9BRAD|nr:hypothetical protein [Bradyrhizobium daqingense]TWI05645.1 hypothetical protein IQ17_03145 [Bradyrhizobium daqingense]UFS91284.1 hypothetical protein LPJ38_11325 [Bradyrhizobium daqingense]
MAQSSRSGVQAAVLVLLVLTAVMLLALLTRTAPHPPLEVAPFALAPFLGASLAIGAVAFQLGHDGTRIGSAFALLFALTALVSFGPQKYVDPAFSRIWPAVITAQGAIIIIVVLGIKALIEEKASDR